MNYVLAFVASKTPLTDRHIRQAREVAAYYHVQPVGTPVWLAQKKAAELLLSARPPGPLLAHLRGDFDKDGIDVFTVPAENRRKKLLLADMESTIVDKEALDELAGFIGIRDQVAAITEKAMNGKLDFKAALAERVGLLKDLPENALQKVLDMMALNPGAKELAGIMKKSGALCVLISGGFTFFTKSIAELAGFDRHHGNTLEIQNGKLTGHVIEPILDKAAKLEFLKSYVRDLKITDDDVMAIGDGANDIPMLKAAGLGIGYHPKEAVTREIDNLILHGDLAASLYIQGFKDSDFTEL